MSFPTIRQSRPISEGNSAHYEDFAEKMAEIAKRHGASEYFNCVSDDVKPGKDTSFPQSVKLHDDEFVVQSWAVYPSKEMRDKANKAIVEDDDFKKLAKHIPVDSKRMFTGGFKVLRGL